MATKIASTIEVMSLLFREATLHIAKVKIFDKPLRKYGTQIADDRSSRRFKFDLAPLSQKTANNGGKTKVQRRTRLLRRQWS